MGSSKGALYLRPTDEKDFAELLREVTAKLPAGQQLSIKVLDVNMAGELEWWRQATQRLRWIEPGSFKMGSPDDEPERFDDEGPQHPVTLTSRNGNTCAVRMWEQGTRYTVAFNECSARCEGNAFEYLWPILIDGKTGRCT